MERLQIWNLAHTLDKEVRADVMVSIDERNPSVAHSTTFGDLLMIFTGLIDEKHKRST